MQVAVANHPTIQRPPVQRVAPSAVVWINGREACVATLSFEGSLTTCEIDRGWLTEAAYLAQVVRVIGDRERVLILGPSSTRLALERDYVALFHRPERLIDVEPSARLSRDEVVELVRSLAA